MSRQIPEIIVPSSLLIPTANDAFSLIAGGMPNGDDCIRVDGDALSGNNSAWVALPDSIFGASDEAGMDPSGWTFQMWLRRVSGGISSAGWGTNSTLGGAYAAGGSSALVIVRPHAMFNGANNSNMVAVNAYTDHLSITLVTNYIVNTNGSSQRTTRGTSLAVNAGEWFMLTAVVSAGGAYNLCYINTAGFGASTVGDNSGGGSGNAYPTPHILSVGNHRPDEGSSTVRSVPGVWDIGKIAFYRTALTPANILALDDSMRLAA